MPDTQSKPETYSKKANAKRAAIKALGPEALEGIDFHYAEAEPGRWTWREGKPPAGAGDDPAEAEAGTAAADDEEIPEEDEQTRICVGCGAVVPSDEIGETDLCDDCAADGRPVDDDEADAEAPVETDATGLRLLSLSALVPSPDNPRRTFDDESLAELAESIAANGILQNLVVRPLEGAGAGSGQSTLVRTGAPMFQIVAGERRYRALQRLRASGRWEDDAPAIPCRVVIAADADARALALLENMQREDVHPMEEADAIADLHFSNPDRWSTAEIGRRIGKTARHVQLRIALVTKLAPAAATALREGRISLAQARALTGAPAKAQDKVVKKIETGGAYYQTAEHVREAAFAGLVPVDRAAFFDPDESGLEILEAPDGARYFVDAAAYRTRQDDATRAKLEELAAEWSWAERNSYFYAGDYEADRSTDRAAAGALLVVEYTGNIRVEEGLVRKVHANPADDPEREARIAENRRRERAITDFHQRLAARLSIDRDVALPLLLTALVRNQSQFGVVPLSVSSTGETAAAFDILAGRSADRDSPFEDDEDLFAAAAALSPAKRDAAFARVVGGALRVDGYQTEPHPIVAVLAARLRVALPEPWAAFARELPRAESAPGEQATEDPEPEAEPAEPQPVPDLAPATAAEPLEIPPFLDRRKEA